MELIIGLLCLYIFLCLIAGFVFASLAIYMVLYAFMVRNEPDWYLYWMPWQMWVGSVALVLLIGVGLKGRAAEKEAAKKLEAEIMIQAEAHRRALHAFRGEVMAERQQVLDPEPGKVVSLWGKRRK